MIERYDITGYRRISMNEEQDCDNTSIEKSEGGQSGIRGTEVPVAHADNIRGPRPHQILVRPMRGLSSYICPFFQHENAAFCPLFPT